MGSLFSRTLERRILILGLDNAGKTTFVKRFSSKENIETVPTIGFSVETVKDKNFKFSMWDVGGQDRIRHLWRHYFVGTDGVLYVVDSTDTQRIDEAASILASIASDSELKDSVFLIVANKQDVGGALSPNELISAMNLSKLAQKWAVMAVSAKTGAGCEDALLYLRSNLKKK